MSVININVSNMQVVRHVLRVVNYDISKLAASSLITHRSRCIYIFRWKEDLHMPVQGQQNKEMDNSGDGQHVIIGRVREKGRPRLDGVDVQFPDNSNASRRTNGLENGDASDEESKCFFVFPSLGK